ncbi:MAG: tripartite tricarboxylate transporter permease [Clostridia bacterium]
MLDMLIAGFLSVLTVETMFLIFVGVFAGIIFGSIPGISATMGVTLFLPLTYGMEPIGGLALLCAVYIGGVSGGLISAVLLNIPGTPASIATTFDGHPMRQKGEAGKALGIGIVYSFLGGIFSLIILMLVAPSLARIAVQFGPFEYCAIALFSLTMVSGLSSGSLVKGLLACLLGITAAFAGIAPVSAATRLTFGIPNLVGGFSTLPVLIGLFALPQIFELAEKKSRKGNLASSAEVFTDYNIKGFGFTMKEFKSQMGNMLQSSFIGTAIGILPGIGGGVSNMFAYGMAQKRSKNPEKFGTGIIDGIVASESANNATTGGALVPLLTLGIPGDSTTAVILAGFTIHNITPGPNLFNTDGVLVYGIFAALFIANIFMIIQEFMGLRLFVKLLSIPQHIMLSVVFIFCVVGTFALNNSMFDVLSMVIFGVVGYILQKLAFPLTPIVLGFILGPLVETNLLRGLGLSDGSFRPFITEPIAAAFIIFTVLTIAFTTKHEVFKKQKVVEVSK